MGAVIVIVSVQVIETVIFIVIATVLVIVTATVTVTVTVVVIVIATVTMLIMIMTINRFPSTFCVSCTGNAFSRRTAAAQTQGCIRDGVQRYVEHTLSTDQLTTRASSVEANKSLY